MVSGTRWILCAEDAARSLGEGSCHPFETAVHAVVQNNGRCSSNFLDWLVPSGYALEARIYRSFMIIPVETC
jgi:hypothetical protein